MDSKLNTKFSRNKYEILTTLSVCNGREKKGECVNVVFILMLHGLVLFSFSIR